MSLGVQGSSANTASAVVNPGSPGWINLPLPPTADLTTPEGIRALNDRLQQIQIALSPQAQPEVSLATKFAFGGLASAGGTATPVPDAKVSLDKAGTWLILCTWDWVGASDSSGFLVIDGEQEATAKRQDALCHATGKITTTAWSLFTAVQIPRLAQLYAKGAGSLDAAGTSICAIWVGQWQTGDKWFGRQVASQYVAATDLNADPLTDHGEAARWPKSDHPDTLARGVDQPGL